MTRNAELMSAIDQSAVEVTQRAEHRVNVPIVRNIIAVIQHWRREERRDPDRIHADRSDVGQPVDDAWQVSDAVAVACPETTGDRPDRSLRRATNPG